MTSLLRFCGRLVQRKSDFRKLSNCNRRCILELTGTDGEIEAMKNDEGISFGTLHRDDLYT